MEGFEQIVDEIKPGGEAISKEAEAEGRLTVAEIEEALENSRWSPEPESGEIEGSSHSPTKNVSNPYELNFSDLY